MYGNSGLDDEWSITPVGSETKGVDTMTQTEMLAFVLAFNAGEFPHLRFGQAFCNATGVADSALYFMRDRKKAEAHAWLYVFAHVTA